MKTIPHVHAVAEPHVFIIILIVIAIVGPPG